MGIERAQELAAGKPSWPTRTGLFVRGYRSRVDGSVQPYAVHRSREHGGWDTQWLEVILHGRGATLNEVSFIYSHDRAKVVPVEHEFIKLDVFGRANVAYRWAGEADVFEAIESVPQALQYRSEAYRTARLLHGRRRRVAPGPALSRSVGGGGGGCGIRGDQGSR